MGMRKKATSPKNLAPLSVHQTLNPINAPIKIVKRLSKMFFMFSFDIVCIERAKINSKVVNIYCR